MMKTLDQGVPVCFTVTHLDGVVFSRAAFNHNILYRSVMAFGTAELLDDNDKKVALAAFTLFLTLALLTYDSTDAALNTAAGGSAARQWLRWCCWWRQCLT